MKNLESLTIARQSISTTTTDVARHKMKAPFFLMIGLLFAGLLFTVISFVESNKEEKRDITSEQYEKKLKWYNDQLDYYDMLEISVHDNYMMLYDKNRESFSIQLADNLLSHPRNMPRGYARDLLSARMIIMKYERANGFKRTRVSRIIPGHPSHQGL